MVRGLRNIVFHCYFWVKYNFRRSFFFFFLLQLTNCNIQNLFTWILGCINDRNVFDYRYWYSWTRWYTEFCSIYTLRMRWFFVIVFEFIHNSSNLLLQYNTFFTPHRNWFKSIDDFWFYNKFDNFRDPITVKSLKTPLRCIFWCVVRMSYIKRSRTPSRFRSWRFGWHGGWWSTKWRVQC